MHGDWNSSSCTGPRPCPAPARHRVGDHAARPRQELSRASSGSPSHTPWATLHLDTAGGQVRGIDSEARALDMHPAPLQPGASSLAPVSSFASRLEISQRLAEEPQPPRADRRDDGGEAEEALATEPHAEAADAPPLPSSPRVIPDDPCPRAFPGHDGSSGGEGGQERERMRQSAKAAAGRAPHLGEVQARFVAPSGGGVCVFDSNGARTVVYDAPQVVTAGARRCDSHAGRLTDDGCDAAAAGRAGAPERRGECRWGGMRAARRRGQLGHCQRTPSRSRCGTPGAFCPMMRIWRKRNGGR